MTDSETFEGWAILELMGHRRLAGYVKEVELAGQGFLRLDVPDHRKALCTCGSSDPQSASHEDHHHDCALFSDELPPIATQFYAAGALYCLTPTTESTARRIAEHSRPTPVHRWELPEPPALPMETGTVSSGPSDDNLPF